MRILLIEDNEDHALLCRMALQDGNRIRTVETIREGLTALAEEPFDAIISDLTLADGAGLEIVQKIRVASKSTPLLVLTGHDSDDLDAEVIEAGAQDFLVKSEVLVSPKSARSAIRRALQHARQRQRLIDEKEHLVNELRDSQMLLVQQNDQLVELCRTAETFVENVSHEFRTPLTIIREYTSLIREGVVGGVNEQQTQMLSVVEDRSDDLNIMVDDLLDVSRLEAGIVSVRRCRFDLPALLDRVLPPLARKAQVRGVHLKVTVPDGLPHVWADAEKLSRALINLVVNAIKFAGQPGLVAIDASHEASSGEVRLAVSDNGPGIPKAQAEGIFERFAQPVTSVRQSTKGFGLGLGIAKELVDLNLGEMSLRSVEEVGSTFGFTVPVAEPGHVFGRHMRRLQKIGFQGDINLFELTTTADDHRETLDLEGLIHSQLDREGQLFPEGDNRWVVVTTSQGAEGSTFQDDLLAAHTRQSRNRPRGPLPELRVQAVGNCRINNQDLPTLQADFESLLRNAKPRSPQTELSHA